MTTGQPADRYECDHCGARLDAPDVSGARTCRYCGSTYQTRADPRVEGGMTFVIQSPPTMTWDPAEISGAAKTASKAGCILGVAITAMILIGVAVTFAVAFSGTDDLFGNIGGTGSGAAVRIDGDSATLLPGEPSSLEVAVHGTSLDGESNNVVVAVSGDPLAERWQAPLDDDSYRTPMAADLAQLYVVDGSHVVAHRRQDAGEGRRGSLTDEPVGGCDDCIHVIGDRLVVLTRDGTINVFATADGQPVWSRTLSHTSSPVLPVGDALVVVDGAGPDSQTLVLAATDGSERFILDTVCREGSSQDRPSVGSVLAAAPDDTTFVVGFGTIPTCLQRWDAATGTQLWSTPFESGGLFLAVTDAVVSWSPDRIALGLDDELLVVDRATGALQHRPDVPDLTYTPLGFTADSLIVRTAEHRGTASFAIEALATDTWAARWQFGLTCTPVEENPSSTVSDNEQVCTTQISGPTMRIVAFHGDDQQLGVSSLDLATGTASATTTLDPGASQLIPSFAVIGWQGDTAVLDVAGSLVLVDTATPAIASSWP